MKHNLSTKTVIPINIFLFLIFVLIFLIKQSSSIENIKELQVALFASFLIVPILFLLWSANKKVSLFNIELKTEDINNIYYKHLLIEELSLSKNSKLKLYSFFKESLFVKLNEGTLEIKYFSHHNINIKSVQDVNFIKKEFNDMLKNRYKLSPS
jgi:hypothetical protein